MFAGDGDSVRLATHRRAAVPTGQIGQKRGVAKDLITRGLRFTIRKRPALSSSKEKREVRGPYGDAWESR